MSHPRGLTRCVGETESLGILKGWLWSSALPKWARAASPLEWALALTSLAAAAYVLAYPFSVVTYPPLVDLPFHAAVTSIFRHYADPSFHFQEQFYFEFLKVPYWTQYLLGAGFATVFPIRIAVKLATIGCLAMLPAGLALLCHGMKKSPYLGLFALPLVWNKLTHWGFVNFVAALGLSAAALGLAFLVLDAPTRARKVGLALLLVLVFATHVFRYPFTLAAVFGAALLLSPAKGRFKELALPVLPSLLLFVLWYLVKDPLSGPESGFPTLHFERLEQAPSLLFDDFVGPEENRLALRSFGLLGLVACASLVLDRIAGRDRISPSEASFRGRASLVVAAVMGMYLLMFLTLPLSIGVWWYVYPREIVAAVFMALALLPDLPDSPRAKLLLLPACGLAAASQARFVAENYRDFERQTADFRQILEFIPKAPRLGYLMLDLTGSTQQQSPYLHLPAWVQAEKGGWLSFHFVSWNHSPVRYREGSAEVPPPTPLRFEWMPGTFDLRTRGRFFDWFLVRSQSSPDRRFAVDPSLRRVAVRGRFWLYKRERGEEPTR